MAVGGHMSIYLLLFFFKQKTAYEMRISDWSSDVCSSDLLFIGSILPKSGDTDAQIENKLGRLEELLNNADHTSANLLGIEPGIFGEKLEIGRASCRERVCPYV